MTQWLRGDDVMCEVMFLEDYCGIIGHVMRGSGGLNALLVLEWKFDGKKRS